MRDPASDPISAEEWRQAYLRMGERLSNANDRIEEFQATLRTTVSAQTSLRWSRDQSVKQLADLANTLNETNARLRDAIAERNTASEHADVLARDLRDVREDRDGLAATLKRREREDVELNEEYDDMYDLIARLKKKNKKLKVLVGARDVQLRRAEELLRAATYGDPNPAKRQGSSFPRDF